MKTPPPPVIENARVICYAFVEDIAYRESGRLYVDGKLLERVPRLAICIGLGEEKYPMLFHCNEQWKVLGTSGRDTVEATKLRAEDNYPGVLQRWVEVNTSVEAALRYIEAHDPQKCSFCGKRPFSIERWFEGVNAIICKGCVETFHDAFRHPEPEAGID